MEWNIIAILPKYTFNNIGEMHIIHFMGLLVVFFPSLVQKCNRDEKGHR